ncbi:MAG: FecR domain-containing protein [Verrucomicrobiae bacterium]|nr:FecR domain-containing protein [Verrucomicrobiae bacterium]
MKRIFTAFLCFFLCIGVAYPAATIVRITVVAFGGKVTITDPEGKVVVPAKGGTLPIGSTISTGPNSWVDLAQGGLSTLRVKAKTQSFTIQRSAFDKEKRQSFSFFKLLNGAVFVRTNKANLTAGSKYQIQMPELIAGVVGSEGECDHGPGGATVHNLSGSWISGATPIPAGQSMANAAGGRPTLASTPPAVVAALTATASTVPIPSGGATGGTCTGGTASGAVPSGSAVSGASVGGTVTAPTASQSTGDNAAAVPALAPPTTQTQPQAEQSSKKNSSPSSP